MRKVPAIAQVRVSLNDGLTILDLKPGNTTKLAELRQIIKNNGFVSKEAAVVARGAATADQQVFIVEGSNEQLVVTAPPRPREEAWSFVVRASERP